MQANAANTAVITREAQFAAEVAALKQTIGAPSGNIINTKGKMFTFPDGTTHPGPLSVVILDYVSHNSYFSGQYDPKNIVPPACSAVGKVIADMKPFGNAPTPQHDNCPECPRNQFGSATTGRGKACKNTRRLAVAQPAGDKESTVMTLSVSPTAIKAFDAYVARIAREYGTPPISMITQISFNPNEAYPTLQFGGDVKHDNMDVMMYLRPLAQEMLLREPETKK